MLNDSLTQQLISAAKLGDAQAKEELLVNNTSLLKSIIKRYLNKGVDYDDLFQLASLGFIKAIQGFDASYNVKFSTYAVPMIAGEIKRFLRDDGSIKVSRSIKRTARELNAYIEEFSLKNNRQPRLKELSERFNIEESELVFILGSTKMPISIYGEQDDDNQLSVIEKLPCKDRQDELIENICLRCALDKLSERERKIIMLRYFRDMTQSEVATQIGVSQVQISRIESKIYADMKKNLSV